MRLCKGCSTRFLRPRLSTCKDVTSILPTLLVLLQPVLRRWPLMWWFLWVGLDQTQEGENYGEGPVDRTNDSVELPGMQQLLIQELA